MSFERRVRGEPSARFLHVHREHWPIAALACFAFAWFAFVAWSACLTRYPVILSDETAYLLPTLYGYTPENYARWGVVPQIPNILFYRLYGLLPGPDIYVAAKLLNAALIASAALPAYLAARRVLTLPDSALFAALAITVPICTFARYFMPESLYYAGFWWTTYLTLAAADAPLLPGTFAVAAALAGMSLIKPHALALVVAVALFQVIRSDRVKTRVAAPLLVIGTWFVLRSVFAWALSGSTDLSVTGPAYRSVADLPVFDWRPFGIHVLGHFAGLCALVGVPAAAAGVVVLGGARRLDPAARDLALLAVCAVVSMIAMTIYFSSHTLRTQASIARLQGRYYAFAFPVLVLAGWMLNRRNVASFPRNTIAVAWCAGVTLISWWVVAAFYRTLVNDYAELSVITRFPLGIAAGGAAIVACVSMLLAFRRFGVHWQPITPLLWYWTISAVTAVVILLSPLDPHYFAPYEVDEVMAHNEVARALRHRGDGLVIAPVERRVDAFKVLFHLASMSRGRFVAPSEVVHRATVPDGVKWLLLLPGATYEGDGRRSMLGSLTYVELE